MNDPRSDAELNRIIAEWMGWKHYSESHPYYKHHDILSFWADSDNNARNARFCTDLNAIHQAEERLEKNKRSFAFVLAQVLNTSPTVDLDDQFENIHATARQRAEALIKVIEGGKS